MLPWFADVSIAGRAPMTASPSHFSWMSPNGDAYPTPRLALARRDFRPVPRRSRSEGSLPARAGRTRCGQAQAAAARGRGWRKAYDEWREALETDDPRIEELHAAWIAEVLSRGLELDEDGRGDVLKRKDWCAAHLNVALPEHGVSLSPDFAVV